MPICMVQAGQKDVYQMILTEVPAMKAWLRSQRNASDKLHLTFDVSAAAGWLYDELLDSVDTLTVSNPSKMTWIYRKAKKTDRIDARKQAGADGLFIETHPEPSAALSDAACMLAMEKMEGLLSVCRDIYERVRR